MTCNPKVNKIASLVSHKWLDTQSVFPAQAGIQLTFLWIPACAGKTIVGRGCRTISALQNDLLDRTLDLKPAWLSVQLGRHRLPV